MQEILVNLTYIKLPNTCLFQTQKLVSRMFDLDMFHYMKLWKESLNIDGQEFNQYQQNETSHLKPLNKKVHDIYRWKSRSSGLRQELECGGVKPIQTYMYPFL